MTLAPSDSPDWTGIPGGLRYLGTIAMHGNGLVQGQLFFTPSSYDGAIYVIQAGAPNSDDHDAVITLICNTVVATTAIQQTYQQDDFQSDPFVGFVSRELGPGWSVTAQIVNATNSSWDLYVFAAPTFPLAKVVRGGIAFQTMQAGVSRREPTDDERFHTPGVTTLATITFPATTGYGWVLDHASWTHIGHGTAGSVIARILDGATVIHQQRLQVGATDGDRDRYSVGPSAGYASAIGASLTVDFSAAPAAGNVEAVAGSAYKYRWTRLS